MNGNKKMRKNAFSLIELVIVIVILGIIAAIAIPRISSGSKNAGEAALRGNLQSIRNAIDWYYGDHNNTYPGANGDGSNAPNSAASFVTQLTQYSDASGNVSDSKSAAFPYGPYLRSGFPKSTAGAVTGLGSVPAEINLVNQAGPVTATNSTYGWVYNVQTGEFRCNSTDTGADGQTYDAW